MIDIFDENLNDISDIKNDPDDETLDEEITLPRGAKPRNRGRKTILTRDVQAKIIQAIRAGAYAETAAAYAGVSKSTFYNWLKQGNKERKGIYRDLLLAIREAWAQTTVADLALIYQAAKKDWRAAAWRLEQREKSKYGSRLQLTGANGKPIEVNTQMQGEVHILELPDNGRDKAQSAGGTD